MKYKYHKISVSLLSMLMFSLITGCALQDIDPAMPSGNKMPDLSAGLSSATRLTTDASGKTTWDENDGLTVFVAQSAQEEVIRYRYAIKDPVKGLFESRDSQNNIPAEDNQIVLPDGDVHDWYAMSPYVADQVRNPFGKPGSEFSLDGQVQDCNDPTLCHLTAYDLMTGCTEGVQVGTIPHLTLQHQVTLMRLTLVNESDNALNLRSVTFEAPVGKALGGSYFVDYRTGLIPALESNKVTVQLENAHLNKGESLKTYMVLCPFELNQGDSFTITVAADEQIWAQQYPVQRQLSFLKGKMNHAEVKIQNGTTNSAFPNLMTVKTVDFVDKSQSGSSATSAGQVKFNSDTQLNVFLEKKGDTSTDWAQASHRYVTSEPDIAGGVFKSEMGVVLDPASVYNAYVMNPYSQLVKDPVGGALSKSAFSLDGQVQDDANPTGHISSYAVMTAVANGLTPGQSAELVLEHKTSLLHLTIPNSLQKKMSLKSLELIAPEGINLGGTFSIDFAQGGKMTSIETDNHISMQFINAKQVEANGLIDVYMVLPPMTLISDDYILVKVHSTEGNWQKRITVKDNIDIKAGEMYTLTVDSEDFDVRQLWSKTAQQQGIWHKLSGVAVNGQSVAAVTWGNDEQTHFILCDRQTGDVVKRLSAPWNFLMRLRTDAAGNFVVNRANYYGAGLHIWTYDQELDSFKQLQWYDAEAGCPAELGVGFSVCGDLTKGLSHVYATAPGAAKAYHFSFSNGNRYQTPNNPELLNLPAFGNWSFANIQRWSPDSNSGFYYSFYEHSKVQNSARTECGSSDYNWNISPFSKDAFLTKILDSQVIRLGNKRLLLTDEQDYSDDSANFLRIYDISNGSPVLIYESQGSYVVNYNHWGNISAWVEETVDSYMVYIAVGNCGQSGTQSNIRMYQLRWNKVSGSDLSLDVNAPGWLPADSWMN